MSTELPKNFGILLFPTFQALDVFGPLDCLNLLSWRYQLNLSIISSTLDPVPTGPRPELNKPNSNFSQSVVPTHDFSTAPPLDVLIIPGGLGVRYDDIQPTIDFAKKVYPSLKYIITICTGSWIAARAGILDDKKATSNKASWAETEKYKNVNWVKHARWVVADDHDHDHKIWTSSGVSAGIDCTLAFIEHIYGKDVAQDIAKTMEYERHEDPSQDPFADMYGL